MPVSPAWLILVRVIGPGGLCSLEVCVVEDALTILDVSHGLVYAWPIIDLRVSGCLSEIDHFEIN
jgi:hypothetical protein